jgi:UDP-glucoronosyl and UDP-glucosyl transferase
MTFGTVAWPFRAREKRLSDPAGNVRLAAREGSADHRSDHAARRARSDPGQCSGREICASGGGYALRQRAAVRHGGSGTLLSTLATGCPVVVIPLFADQPANARAAEAAGAGLAVFTHHADEIAKPIRAVLTSESIREGAQNIAAELASMHPMNEAIAEMISIAGK